MMTSSNTYRFSASDLVRWVFGPARRAASSYTSFHRVTRGTEAG